MAKRSEESFCNAKPKAATVARAFARLRGDIEHSETGASEKMADLLGESPNLFDDLFRDLEDWEVVLNSFPDFGVG